MAMRGRGARWSVWLVDVLVAAAVLVIAPIGAMPVAGASEYVPLPTPRRLLDTRPGASTFDNQFAGIGLRPPESTLELQVAGRAGVPVDVSTVVLNVTAADATAWGFVTVHPTGTGRPNASNLNYTTGQTIANTVITRVGVGGDISIYTYAATHLIVDVAGHLPADSFTPLPAPRRLLDTRPGTSTFDGQYAGIGLQPAGSTLQMNVAGRAGIPTDASVVVLNVTATIPDVWGFVTVHPAGTSRPNASNLNYTAGDTIANTVITRIGTGGDISIYTYAATHLIVDIAGHLPVDTFAPLPAPQRLADTRPGAPTIDGHYAGIGMRPNSSTLQLHIAGRAGIPTNASSVVLNVTAVDPLGWGFLTEHPTGTARPNASNLNYIAGQTIANTVIAQLGAGGDVCIYTYAATHLIVDAAGYLPGPPPPAAGPTCPGQPSFTVADLGESLIEGVDMDYWDSYELDRCYHIPAVGTMFWDAPILGESDVLVRGMVLLCVIRTEPPADIGEDLVVMTDDRGGYRRFGASSGEPYIPFQDSLPGLTCEQFLAHPDIAHWLTSPPMLSLGSADWAYTLTVAYWFLENEPPRMDVNSNGIPCEWMFPPGIGTG